jgi:hypothetical protein
VYRVFEQNDELTCRSSFELNADKTEILALHTSRSLTCNVSLNEQIFSMLTVKELKICGIYNKSEREYHSNITKKIGT